MAASTESSGIYAELARVQEHGSSMAKGAAVSSIKLKGSIGDHWN